MVQYLPKGQDPAGVLEEENQQPTLHRAKANRLPLHEQPALIYVNGQATILVWLRSGEDLKGKPVDEFIATAQKAAAERV